MVEPTVSLAPPAAAAEIFGDRLELACGFVELLAAEGVRRGLVGPRETARLWERHVLNSAVLGELIEPGVRVIDVGSGGGFPGLPLVIARPDLAVTLVEPTARRVAWLDYVTEELGVAVHVVRGRAEEKAVRDTVPRAEVVTSRAVAPLDRLSAWCLPLAADGGAMLAVKGARAEEEIVEHHAAITRAGGGSPAVWECGRGTLEQPTRVVHVRRTAEPPRKRRVRKDR